MALTIKLIDLDQACDILADCTINNTIDTGGMLAHEIDHPTIGTAITVQYECDVLLITG